MLAAKHPDRLHSLTLISVTGGRWQSLPTNWAAIKYAWQVSTPPLLSCLLFPADSMVIVPAWCCLRALIHGTLRQCEATCYAIMKCAWQAFRAICSAPCVIMNVSHFCYVCADITYCIEAFGTNMHILTQWLTDVSPEDHVVQEHSIHAQITHILRLMVSTTTSKSLSCIADLLGQLH